MKSFTATDAKNKFGAILDAAVREPVEVIKNGKLTAYIVSAGEFESMRSNHAFAKAMAGIVANDPAVMGVLIKYSKGLLRKEDAIEDLGIQYYGQLLDLLGVANLSLPMVSKQVMNVMVKEALEVFGNVKEA